MPNLGLSVLADLVRTKSTTGTPRRQIVTVSPDSTALMSSGSLFFASATFTFMIHIIAIIYGYVMCHADAGPPTTGTAVPLLPPTADRPGLYYFLSYMRNFKNFNKEQEQSARSTFNESRGPALFFVFPQGGGSYGLAPEDGFHDGSPEDSEACVVMPVLRVHS